MKPESRPRLRSAYYNLCPRVLLAIAFSFAVSACDRSPAPERFQFGDYRVEGPYVHKNLAVYLVAGKGAADGRSRRMLSLQEALNQKVLKVYETEDVGELEVENFSKHHAVFIHAGDIVKGGQQDRVIPNDFILPPLSGRLPVDSFCVEQGRWAQREGESKHEFESAEYFAASRELKIKSRAEKDQSGVWDSVQKIQGKLSRNVGSNVRDEKSATSLQLTLENKKLNAAVDDYMNKLASRTAEGSDAIGMAYYVNGELNSVEMYGSPELFRKFRKKLLRSAATEAVADLDEWDRDKKRNARPEELKSMLAGQAWEKKTERRIARESGWNSYETDDMYLFESTAGKSAGGGKDWYHRSYVKK